MKFLLPALFSMLLIAVGCQAPVAPAPSDGRVTVTFEHPEKFTDVRSTYQGETDQGYLDQLRSAIDTKARLHLADGQKLTLNFTDIDMAGDFEPWHARATDVRIVKAIYIPRMKFTYAVIDAAGKTVKGGEENLSDMNFQSHIRINNSDTLFYEKELINDWMNKTLKP